MSREQALAIATTAMTPPPAAPPTEAAPAAGEAPKDDLVSSRIAQIARKEAKYREEQDNFKKELEAFKQSKSQFDPFYEKYKQFEEMRGKDPVAAIKMLGFSDTDYVNFVAAQEDKSTPEERAAKIADAKIAEFRKEQETAKQAEEAKRNEESIASFKKSINESIKADPEKFEFCNFYGEAAESLVMKIVQESFQEDLKSNPNAEPMTAAQAAELAESYYEEEAQNIIKLKKLNKAADPAAEPEKVEVPVAKKEEPLKAQVNAMPPKTLTNKVTTTVAATVKKPESPSEKRERLKRWLSTGVKQ